MTSVGYALDKRCSPKTILAVNYPPPGFDIWICDYCEGLTQYVSTSFCGNDFFREHGIPAFHLDLDDGLKCQALRRVLGGPKP